ncbi:hypothetical protein KDL29_05070 [bacterium]|nr:hypothetical protein [bacterium]MCB1220344.1 hypothetical protein [bacterium]UNM08396.1 MAG: hypothetical protein H7A35_16340 [Planctomycetales bacterium]
MKQGFKFGQTQGGGASGWGIGTTPYGSTGSEATDPQIDSSRMNGSDSLMDTGTTQYDQLYDSQDLAHGVNDEQLHGQFNQAAPPSKVEEVKSSPETQEALREFVNTVGADNIGDQQAIDTQNIPRDYKELHRKYFDNVKKATEEKKKAAEAKEKEGKPFEEKKDKPAEPKEE